MGLPQPPPDAPAEFTYILLNTLPNGNKIYGGQGQPTNVAGNAGDVYIQFNSLFNIPSFWYCSVSGNPGTWVNQIIETTFSGETFQVLGLDGTSINLTDAGGGSLNIAGGLVLPVNIQTGNYTLQRTDFTVVANGSANQTFTLPNAPNQHYNIFKNSLSAYVLTIAAPSGGSINGQSSINVTTTYASSLFFSDSSGNKWYMQNNII